MECIYCLQDLPPENYRRAEHVIPQSMGKFENNLTLNGIVCDDCNQHFGNTIELMLGRGSIEALLRMRYGVAPPEKARKLRRDRIRLRLPRDDEWNGLIIELIPEKGEVVFRPVPQVGFRRSRDDWFKFVAQEDLKRNDLELPAGPYCKEGIKIVADSESMQARLVELLHERGVRFCEERSGPIPAQAGELAPTEILARMDRVLMRCAAKIAFNYLADREGRYFVLHESFNAIRRFIRWDERAPYPLVAADDQPILADDSVHRRQTNGHLLTIGWANDGRSVLGQVSLFNHVRYRISLARGYSGLWRPLRHGHHFCVETRKVARIHGTDLWTPRPRGSRR